MRVTIAGFLTDQSGRVLLRQTDRPELFPVTCSLAAGELPAEALARAFREITGLYVLPVRLVGLYLTGGNTLTLAYRCALRGGELQPPAGQLAANFFNPQPIPRGLSDAHRRQLEDALHHAGGPPTVGRLPATLGERFQRLIKGEQPEETGPEWVAGVKLVVDCGHGQVVWRRANAGEPWRLPAERLAPGEAPWETAERLWQACCPQRPGKLLGLAPLEPLVAGTDITFVFLAGLYEPPFPRVSGETIGFIRPDPANPGLDAADVALTRLAL